MGTAPSTGTHTRSRKKLTRKERREAYRRKMDLRRLFLAEARQDGRIPDGPGLPHSIRVYPLPLPVKRTELSGKHTTTALRRLFRTLTKGVLLPMDGEPGCPEEFRIPAEDCDAFLVDIISRARAHWLLNVFTVVGFWAAAAYHGLPYWCDDAPVVLLGRHSRGDARSWKAKLTPTRPVFLRARPGLTTVCPDPAFPELRVVTADIAAGQCLFSLLSGTHGWDVPDIPGLTAREVRAVQFLDAMFQCSRLTSATVDRLLELSDPGAQSPRETLLRLYVRNLLPEGYTWTSQVTVLLDPDGRPWKHLIADLACPELKIALFYDGTYHRAEERRSLDFHQVQRLRALEWESVRVDAALMAEVDTMMEDMRDAVDRAVAAI